MWGAAGRVILAHLPVGVVEIVRRTAPPCPVTGKAAPGRASLNRMLDRIRERGYDSSRGEIITRDIVAVAAPLFGAEQRILGNLSVATANPQPAEVEAAADLLLAKSRKLSLQLARIKMI
jgi:DNA-binding IclR family transcriptional regulator